MIPTAAVELFTRIDFFAFLVFLSIVSMAWLVTHLLDTLEAVIIRFRKFLVAIRRNIPDEPQKVIPSPP